MNSQQVQDMRLMYEAVYNDELWELANEYNNTVYDEDIVEVATEYFYTYGLNEDGIDILIEKVGLDNFVEFVYDLSEDLTILTEERSAKKRTSGESYADVKAKIDAKEAAKKKAKSEALKRKESERMETASNGADTESKKEQPKSKKPIRDAIARQILAGMERHRKATQTAGRLASETGNTLGKIASVTREAGRRAGEHVKKHGLKSLANEEVENWVNSLIEEGYDLSDYTWEEMAEIYIDEAAKRSPKKVRGAKDTKSYQDGRSQAGMMVSGDSQVSGAGYMRRGGGIQTQTDPNERQPQQGRMDRYTRDEMEYRKARLKKESHDLFDTILEHLIAEGFADTNEAALAIMANMSEEWREEILDEATIRSVTSPSGKRIYKSPEYSSDERANISKTTHQQKRLKQRHYASTSDARDDQRSFEHDERQETKKRKHPTNIMNAKPGESEHYGADEGDGYHYDTVKTDRNARKRRASGR